MFELPLEVSHYAKTPKWIFPEDKYVEWGPEDESYCRAAGYGHEEQVPCGYIVDAAAYKKMFDDLIKLDYTPFQQPEFMVHPTIYEQLKKYKGPIGYYDTRRILSTSSF